MSTSRIACLVLSLTLASGWTTGQARTWHITPDSTGDARTIQAGIDSATAGDEVVLAPGTYTWASQASSGASMIVMKANVSLRGEAGPQSTFLNAQRLGRVIYCKDVGDVRIEGMTLTSGKPPGGGIYSIGTSRPTISNCFVQRNLGHGSGAGIFCDDAGATISDCQILDNQGQHDANGGGIWIRGGRIERCTIRGNTLKTSTLGFGGGVDGVGTTIQDCWFEANGTYVIYGPPYGHVGGGGVYLNGGSIERCTFRNNEAEAQQYTPADGGGVKCAGAVTISECVFVGNNAIRGTGGAISSAPNPTINIDRCTILGNRGGSLTLLAPGTTFVSGTILAWGETMSCTGTASFSCCDLFANSSNAICGSDGGGNFSLNPLFCSSDPITTANVLLSPESPCAPGHHEPCLLIGAAPVSCTVAITKTTWTEMKQRYAR